jgi:hypothetical protein
MLKFFLLFILFPLLIFSQESSGQQPNENNFTPAKLIEGVPSALVKNGYFYPPEEISYALILEGKNDSLYFIRKKINSDSINYILVLISNKKITDYDYLNFKKIRNDSLFAVSNIKYQAIYTLEFCYPPNNYTIYYKFLVEKKNKLPINVELGIRDEVAVMFANYYNYKNGNSNHINTFLPLNLHLSIGFRFLENYKIDFRIGLLLLYEDYVGIDKGIFLETKLFKSNYYGVLGVDFFSNGGNAHGVAVYSESGGDVTSLCFGLGYSTSRHFNIDLMYYLPFNKVYGYNYVAYDYNENYTGKRYDKINNGVITLGFQYSFIF